MIDQQHKQLSYIDRLNAGEKFDTVLISNYLSIPEIITELFKIRIFYKDLLLTVI